MPDNVCPECAGTGFVIREVGGVERAAHCLCWETASARRRLESARIPRRYAECSLENFYPLRDSLVLARRIAEEFIADYPLGTATSGLLFLGNPGLGKTHLAVSILRELVVEKGVRGIFYDYGDLLKTIQASWDRDSQISESAVLEPVTGVELLVLDDLGATRPTLWVQEILFHVLNTRYNDNRVTILTSNHLDTEHDPTASAGRQRDLREASLEHQIGIRLRSRLHEMCRTVVVEGDDYRRKVKNTDFATGG